MEEQLSAALAAAGVEWDRVAGWRQLEGGTFNTVLRVRLDDGAALVVKLAPDPAVPVLRYERGLLETEARYYALAGGVPGVPLPEVLPSAGGEGHLVMTECPGATWSELADRLGGEERRLLRTELGRHTAALHTVAGEAFGYPAQPLGPLRPTWREAFLEMVDAVLADAERFAVTLPQPTGRVRELFAAQGPLLDEVTVPRLVHFDLWDGNILVGRGPRISGLIDAERAFWGDPLAELVSLCLFRDIDEPLLQGYRSAGGTVTLDPPSLRRLALYRSYLYLIMWVEAVPRRSDAQRLAYLDRQVRRPLAAVLDDWAAGRVR